MSAGATPDPDGDRAEAEPGAEPDEVGPDEVGLDEIRLAVNRLDPRDEDWSDLQWHLADRLHDRYRDTGDPADLAEALRRGRLVVDAQQATSPAHLVDLAVMTWDRYADASDGDALAAYVRLNERALALLDPDGDADLLADCRANLATGLMTRHGHGGGDPHDVERALALWTAALDHDGLDPRIRGDICANLAQAMSDAYDSIDDLRRAVDYGRTAWEAPAATAEERAYRAFGLANALTALHTRSVTETTALEEAIDLLRQGLTLLGAGHPDHAGYTANLADLLVRHAQGTSEPADLTEAVRLVREVCLPIAREHPDRAHVLNTAAAVLSEQAHWTDDLDLLQHALDLYREAREVAAAGSPERGVALANFASTCREVAEQLNHRDQLALVEEGLAAGRGALRTFREPDTHRAQALTATGNLLRDRYLLTGRTRDLDRAIARAEQALDLTPPGHAQYAARQTNLAVLLSDDYTERANLAALDRAIDLYRAALASPEPLPRRVAERRSDLALALRDRYRDSQDSADLDEAVALAARSTGATPPDSPAWAGYASNYGNALVERYQATRDAERAGDGSDLDHAIALFRAALDSAVGDLPGRAPRPIEASGYATNLGLALAARAQPARDAGRLGDAVDCLARAVDLLPDGHPDAAHRLSNLADVHRVRSVLHHDGGDAAAALLDARRSVELARQAVDLAGTSDARLLPALANLARAQRLCHTLAPSEAPARKVLAREALETQRRAALLDRVPPAEKFGQSALWARAAEEQDDPAQAMSAYRRAVSLIPEVAWIGLGVEERLAILTEMAEVLTGAVGLAVRTGAPWTALAWADRIRSVLWRQDLQVSELLRRGAPTDTRLLRGLVSAPAQEEGDPAGDPTRSTYDGSGGDALRRRDRRSIAHRESARLQAPAPGAAAYRSLRFPGALILLVPGDEGSTALLVRNGSEPEIVPLPSAPRRRLAERVDGLRAACGSLERTGAGAEEELRARHTILDCLDWLWSSVAEPVVARLGSDPGTRHRLWWSPVGEFALLPVHAAGRHPRKAVQLRSGGFRGQALADHAVSSYLPTILPAPQAPTTAMPPAAPRMLVVTTDAGTGTIGHAETELQAIRTHLPDAELLELRGQAAVPGAVRDLLPGCRYLHVAAHGDASAEDALRAGIRLAEGTFTLGSLARCEVADAELAVFMSCDSASGTTRSPNEALHLASAAMHAGFREVLAATMPLRDASVAPVCDRVYATVAATLRGTSSPAASVAEALHTAVEELRHDPGTGTDPLSWAPLAHLGWGHPG